MGWIGWPLIRAVLRMIALLVRVRPDRVSSRTVVGGAGILPAAWATEAVGNARPVRKGIIATPHATEIVWATRAANRAPPVGSPRSGRFRSCLRTRSVRESHAPTGSSLPDEDCHMTRQAIFVLATHTACARPAGGDDKTSRGKGV